MDSSQLAQHLPGVHAVRRRMSQRPELVVASAPARGGGRRLGGRGRSRGPGGSGERRSRGVGRVIVQYKIKARDEMGTGARLANYPHQYMCLNTNVRVYTCEILRALASGSPSLALATAPLRTGHRPGSGARRLGRGGVRRAQAAAGGPLAERVSSSACPLVERVKQILHIAIGVNELHALRLRE